MLCQNGSVRGREFNRRMLATIPARPAASNGARPGYPAKMVVIPWFEAFQREYGDAGLLALGVSLDEDARAAMRGTQVNYPGDVSD